MGKGCQLENIGKAKRKNFCPGVYRNGKREKYEIECSEDWIAKKNTKHQAMCSRSKRFSALRRNNSGWLSSCLLECTESHELIAANQSDAKCSISTGRSSELSAGATWQEPQQEPQKEPQQEPRQEHVNPTAVLCCNILHQEINMFQIAERSSIKAGTCFLLEVLPVPVPMVLWTFVRIPLEVCSLSNDFPISGSNTCRPATPWPSSATLSDLRARNVRDYTSRPLEPSRVSWVGDSAIGESTRLPCRGKCHVQKVLCFILIYYILLYCNIL